MPTTQTIRRRARRFEQVNDGLSLLQQVRECCDLIDHLHKLIAEVSNAWLAWGPTDDGTSAGLRLEQALSRLLHNTPRPMRDRT